MLKYFFIICALFSVSSNAVQTHFSKNKAGDDYHFSFGWVGQDNSQQHLAFNLSQRAILDKFRGFTPYQPEILKQKVTQSIYRTLRKEPIKGARVTFNKVGEQYTIELSGKDKSAIAKAQQKINELEAEKTKAYLTKHYYQTFTNYKNEVLIKPNHVAIANQSVDDLKPLKKVILNKLPMKNIKNATNYTLNFVQNIPYSTLESRITSSGAGFNPPLKLLWENQGDCDSKVTLTAALLRMLMPRIKMVMVFLDNHALIGINVTPQNDDNQIRVDNVTYVLAEPTGPMAYPLGQLAPESEMAIANGHYTVEAFHAIKKATQVNEQQVTGSEAKTEPTAKSEDDHFDEQ